ncbi:hypothetical protein VKT23_005029 [Stygiomarasmius scandens]|uniref:Uncharacterized protein n=1 Tax=Marasmiellus scandens TaxID=2682957 RepID=A0ABR1JS36_9AGAR
MSTHRSHWNAIPKSITFLTLLLAVSGSPIFPYAPSLPTKTRRNESEVHQTRDVLTSANNYLSQSTWGPFLAATVIDPMLYPDTSRDLEATKARANELLQDIGKESAPLATKDYWKDFGGALKKVGGLISLIVEAVVKTSRE